MLFRAHVVDDDEFSNWVADEKIGHKAPNNMNWDEWYAALRRGPKSTFWQFT